MTLPGIVHRFAAGHSLRLVVAGGSDDYHGGLVPVPMPATMPVPIGSGRAQTLTLPVVG